MRAPSFFAAALAAVACGSGPVAQPSTSADDPPALTPTGAVRGRVCDHRFGAHLVVGTAAIEAPAGRMEAALGEDGWFELSGLPPGAHGLTVEGVVGGMAASEPVWRMFDVVIAAGETAALAGSDAVCAMPDPTTTGSVTGRVCLDIGGDVTPPLPGVRVVLMQEIDGVTFETQSDRDGAFSIVGVPTPLVGAQVRAMAGSRAVQWDDVTVLPTADMPAGTALTVGDACAVLRASPQERALIVEGFFDPLDTGPDAFVDATRIDGTPNSITELWSAAALGNFDVLAQHDVLFVSSGVNDVDFSLGLNPAIVENVRLWVEQGGRLYASGSAYPLLERVWPDDAEFVGDDAVPGDASRGLDGAVLARVTDPMLAAFVGSDELAFDLRLPGAPVPLALGSACTALLRADVSSVDDDGTATLHPGVPVTYACRHGLGEVLYTGFFREYDAIGGLESISAAAATAFGFLLAML